jgi:hypothetical protein
MGIIEIPKDFAVPYPPDITPEEVISRRSPEKLKSRPPNRFFIYRLAYIKQLKKFINIKKFSMTKISPHISKSWSAERTEVKQAYKKLADKVEDQLENIRKKNFILISENPGSRCSTPTTTTPPPPPTPPLPSSPQPSPPSSPITPIIHDIFEFCYKFI